MLRSDIASLNYRRVQVDISAARDRVEVEAPGLAIKSIEVREITTLTKVELHFGLRSDPVIVRQGSRVRIPGKALGTGLYLSCGAGGGAGDLATLVMQYDDERYGGPAFEIVDP